MRARIGEDTWPIMAERGKGEMEAWIRSDGQRCGQAKDDSLSWRKGVG